ncbi:FtsX-like permease family protein [Phycicoccus duodecadis]|uniref:FtsX-like permease family protein n=1 Tax=Phycicoccus duodecadis TaxID=173053 RepID=A0A2N3YMB0_9MICO|nr:FtsX-like permease family protein [Phycicoccus duodecadis]PKW28005.1 FtsX-like permease family protein [Phycicoccus duodecadis]
MWTLLARRARAHPAAVVAVAVSVLTSLLVVATLQLLAGGIADAAVRGEVDGPVVERSVALSAGLRPGELAPADRRVRAVVATGGDGLLTRAATATARGIAGRAATDRAQLLDLDDLPRQARLVAGAWPRTPAAPGGVVEVALPENAAAPLGAAVGDVLALTDLTAPDAAPLRVRVTGVFRPTQVAAGRWVDEPLGGAGVRRTDFTTYGPFVTGPGAFDTGLVPASTVTWRWVPDLRGLDASSGEATRARVARVVDGLQRLGGVGGAAPATGEPLRDGDVTTGLPARLAAAELSRARVTVALLAPTVLLALLGTASLVVAASLLATLRDRETRLLRMRGASTRRLAVLALADAAVVVGVGSVLALLLAPPLARLVASRAGVDLPGTAADGIRSLLVVVALMALAGVLVVVGTTLRVGRGGGAPRAGGAVRLLRVLGSSGLDVALVALSVLGVVQLRRYDGAGSDAGGTDPLSVAAPALVVAGSAVLCLRLLPVLSRQVARVTGRGRGLDLAWGGWQLSRRLASQSGTVLLVLLAVTMGSLALSRSATADRALLDQSSYETGGPVRVVTGALGDATVAATGATLVRAAGAQGRVAPVARTTTGIGPVDGVTVLAADAAALAAVADPRPDTLGGRSWAALTRGLVADRAAPTGVGLPTPARSLVLTLRVEAQPGVVLDPRFTLDASVLLREGSGLEMVLPLGAVGVTARELAVDLPAARGGPSTLLAVLSTVPTGLAGAGDGSSSATPLRLALDRARTDAGPLTGLGVLRDRSRGADVLLAGDAAAVEAVPAVVTAGVADAAGVAVGGRLEVEVSGRPVPLVVSAVVGSLPTAADPTRAVLLDLLTVLATGEGGTADRRPSLRVVEPTEWWVAPGGALDVDALRSALPGGSTVTTTAAVLAERTADPVNAGMRAAMLLVTGAALLLAAVGLGATTAALGRERRRENAVLLALGASPRRIRAVLEAERVAVVVLTVAVGSVLGVLAAVAVVPVLVGGDGHRQVPSVLVNVPGCRLLLFAVVVTGALGAVGVLVLRRVAADVAAELRRGEAS